MGIGAAEAFLLAALVALLYWLIAPLRRRLEVWFARRLTPKAGRPRVVVLERYRRHLRGGGSS